jgi:hypothetical protein
MDLKIAYQKLTIMPGGVTADRLQKLTEISNNVPDSANVVVCGDEKTGVRFGQAKCRAGRCLKIGSGGRNKGATVRPYQIWAVWE